MKTNRRAYALKEAEKIVPLLRSIGREIKARLRATEAMQKRLESLRGGPRGPKSPDRPKRSESGPPASVLEAQIATHLREMRSAEKELERLGCRLDEDHPLRILIPSPNGDWAFDGHLEETRFHASSGGGGS